MYARWKSQYLTICRNDKTSQKILRLLHSTMKAFLRIFLSISVLLSIGMISMGTSEESSIEPTEEFFETQTATQIIPFTGDPRTFFIIPFSSHIIDTLSKTPNVSCPEGQQKDSYGICRERI